MFPVALKNTFSSAFLQGVQGFKDQGLVSGRNTLGIITYALEQPISDSLTNQQRSPSLNEYLVVLIQDAAVDGDRMSTGVLCPLRPAASAGRRQAVWAPRLQQVIQAFTSKAFSAYSS